MTADAQACRGKVRFNLQLDNDLSFVVSLPPVGRVHVFTHKRVPSTDGELMNSHTAPSIKQKGGVS